MVQFQLPEIQTGWRLSSRRKQSRSKTRLPQVGKRSSGKRAVDLGWMGVVDSKGGWQGKQSSDGVETLKVGRN